MQNDNKLAKVLNDKTVNILAIGIPVAVMLLLGIRVKLDLGSWTNTLPHINGLINSLTSFFLIIALAAIRRKNITLHRTCMLICVVLGLFFLVAYILYHLTHNSTPYGGTSPLNYVYYFLLITHIILAAVVVYFVLKALHFAFNSDFERHKKIVKWAYPIWLYVSVSGVLVYLMISPYYTF
jgi:putative membrane protein